MYEDSLQQPSSIVDPLEVLTLTLKPTNLFMVQIADQPIANNNLLKLEEMGLLEEEWSGAGIADMVWSKEEGEESGGQPLHHHHHQELVKEVKGDVNQRLVSTNELLENFGPLRIGVLENGR